MPIPHFSPHHQVHGPSLYSPKYVQGPRTRQTSRYDITSAELKEGFTSLDLLAMLLITHPTLPSGFAVRTLCWLGFSLDTGNFLPRCFPAVWHSAYSSARPYSFPCGPSAGLYTSCCWPLWNSCQPVFLACGGPSGWQHHTLVYSATTTRFVSSANLTEYALSQFIRTYLEKEQQGGGEEVWI